jgi:hypothetical protein
LDQSIVHQVTEGLVTVVEFPAWDVNMDGVVNIFDLQIVAVNIGLQPPKNLRADVNKDGIVNIFDLIKVAGHFGEKQNPAAPDATLSLNPQHALLLQQWIVEARATDDGSEVFRKGIAVLELLLSTIVPERTRLLSNYPNPFNPETWIPYQLASDAEVVIRIYNISGALVRQLDLGN